MPLQRPIRYPFPAFELPLTFSPGSTRSLTKGLACFLGDILICRTDGMGSASPLTCIESTDGEAGDQDDAEAAS